MKDEGRNAEEGDFGCRGRPAGLEAGGVHLWYKSVAAANAERWTEQVGEAVAPGRIALVQRAGGSRERLEVYCEAKREADGLARRFGGQVRAVRAESWQPTPATRPGRPLAVGGRLWVTGREEELPALRAAHPGGATLCIPAAMAFGTGEHATTAMCLRFLAEVSDDLPTPWDVLDLGSGSGILALAGRLFGARGAVGLDNDPHAVRTARENAVLNGMRGVRFGRADLLQDELPGRPGGWPVVAANLFSELLTALLPLIRRLLANDGVLIASGILASQAAALEEAFVRNHLELVTKRRRGKWTAFLVRRARRARANQQA